MSTLQICAIHLTPNINADSHCLRTGCSTSSTNIHPPPHSSVGLEKCGWHTLGLSGAAGEESERGGASLCPAAMPAPAHTESEHAVSYLAGHSAPTDPSLHRPLARQAYHARIWTEPWAG